MMLARRVGLAALLAAVIVGPGITGCATQTPAIGWHSLVGAGSKAAAAPASAAAGTLTLVVGPVSVPDEVDRSQLVVHTANGGVMLLDNQRWTAALKTQLPRAIAFAISRRIPDALIAAYPNTALARPQWRLLVDVQRFELRQDMPGSALLRALWTLQPSAPDSRAAPAQLTDVRIDADPTQGIDGLVEAMQDALAQLAVDVQAQLCTLQRC